MGALRLRRPCAENAGVVSPLPCSVAVSAFACAHAVGPLRSAEIRRAQQR